MTDPKVLEQLDLITGASARVRELLAPPPAPTTPYPLLRNDRRLAPKPALPPMGPAGYTWRDPEFGTSILRVTDGSMGGSSHRVASNAHVAVWNRASDTFWTTNAGGSQKLWRFDPIRFTCVGAGDPRSQTEGTFSRSDPDTYYTIYGPETRTIRRHSVKNGLVTDVVDLDAVIPGLKDPRTYVGNILAAGVPEDLAILCGGQGQDDHYLVLLYAPTTGTWFVLDSRKRFNCNLHGISRDLTGRYVFLYPRTGDIAHAGQVIIWDTLVDRTTVPTRSTGHDTLGFGVWINTSESPSKPYDGLQWARRDIATPSTILDLIPTQLTPSLKCADHPNWMNAQPGVLLPFITATYRNVKEAADALVPPRAWDDEILLVSSTGDGDVRRVAHHRSQVVSEIDPTKLEFWAEPMIHIAPDGNHAVFHSNMELGLGLEPGLKSHRQDVFLVKLR